MDVERAKVIRSSRTIRRTAAAPPSPTMSNGWLWNLLLLTASLGPVFFAFAAFKHRGTAPVDSALALGLLCVGTGLIVVAYKMWAEFRPLLVDIGIVFWPAVLAVVLFDAPLGGWSALLYLVVGLGLAAFMDVAFVKPQAATDQIEHYAERRQLREKARTELRRARRSDTPFSLLVVDGLIDVAEATPLREFDVAYTDLRTEITTIVCPDTDIHVIEGLERRLRDQSNGLHVAHSSFPTDGVTLSKLEIAAAARLSALKHNEFIEAP